MVKQKEIPGGIVKVLFDKKWHTYARILNYGDLAFYDCKTQEEINDLQHITSKPILFACIVNINGVQKGQYPIIGELPLEEELKNSIYYLTPAVGSDQYRISDNGEIRNASKEECIGLELGAVWDPVHIDIRLTDHYAGRENQMLKAMDTLGNYKLNA